MVGRRPPVHRLVAGVHSEAEKDNIPEAIDNALHEVQAARRDLRMTAFCLQQAEVIRRIDRARASLADLAQFRNRKADPGLGERPRETEKLGI
jgi:hypothetical protein